MVYEKGQTGVENLSIPFVRLIGVSEILGAIGLILPRWLNILPILTPVAAILFAFVMILPQLFITGEKNLKIFVQISYSFAFVFLLVTEEYF